LFVDPLFEDLTKNKIGKITMTPATALDFCLFVALPLFYFMPQREAWWQEPPYKDFRTGQRYLKVLKQLAMVEQNHAKQVVITEKGDRFLYETILPIFSNHQIIAKKVFFRESLSQEDIVVQEKLNGIESFFTQLKPSTVLWFKKWMQTQFGKYDLYQDIVKAFEKDHAKFLQNQVKNEKKRIVNTREGDKKW
jgi:hypothetical protein